MRQIYPVPGPDWDVVPRAAAGPLPAAVAQLAALYGNGAAAPAEAARPWLRANMIASTDGAAALDGLSGTLSGQADRMVFTVLRSLADVILVGAGTVRAERYRPVSAAGIWTALRPAGAALPAIAVVTRSPSADALATLLGKPGSEPPIVLTTASAAASGEAALAGRARVIAAGAQRVEVRAAVTALARLGYRQILAEGGPSLLGQLVDAGLLDELCVTVSPVLAAGFAGRIVSSPHGTAGAGESPAGEPARMTLAHVLTDEGFLLCRYVRAR